MAQRDRDRQQQGEAPQGAAQQGAWEPARGAGSETNADRRAGRGGARDAGYGSRAMPAQRARYETSAYGGGPFAMMRRISDEMDRIFESFAGGGLDPWSGGGPAAGMRTLWSPQIEVCERDGKLIVQADLPGVRKDDVNVDIEDDRIVIQGQRSEERSGEESGVWFSERSYGSFHRVVPLPEGIDSSEAKATFRDGVLQIELPVPRERQRGRRLSIQEPREAEAGGSDARSAAGQGGTTPAGERNERT